jgi:hypothetical protein
MLKMAMFWSALLLPVVGWSCDVSSSDRECHRRLTALVNQRTEAIRVEFGDLEPIMPRELTVNVQPASRGRSGPKPDEFLYDTQTHTLSFSRRVAKQSLPTEVAPLQRYWTIYQNEDLRREYALVESIDNALWSVYLKEAASRAGLSWPHAGCEAQDFSERLPCEMLLVGTAEYLNRERQRIFNTNRLETIWPEDYDRFCAKVWHRDDEPSKTVKLYGGQLLLQPLVRKFGIPRALAYAAQTPFTVADNNMRTSALRYQEQGMKADLVLSKADLPVPTAAVLATH